VADLELGKIREAQFDLDVVGHYARPDLFRLFVNRQVQRSVETD
jgi:nitrilase